MTEGKRTRKKWIVDSVSLQIGEAPAQVITEDGEDIIADCYSNNGIDTMRCLGNAAFIVQACNAYDGLIRAIRQDCKDADCEAQGFGRPSHRCWHMKAIDKSEGRP